MSLAKSPSAILPAIAFLVGLVVVSGVILMTSEVISIAGSDLAPGLESAEALEARIVELRAEAERLEADNGDLRRRIADLEERLALVATLQAARDRLAAMKATIEVRTEELAGLDDVIEQLRARLQALEDDAKYERRVVARREDLEAAIRLLELDVAELEAEIGRVMVEIEEIEQGKLDVSELVPHGIRRKALFAETDGEGLWMMPERTRLTAPAAEAAKVEFLTRARAKGTVMFLIRPDGFEPFFHYRAVLEQHNKSGDGPIDYGYQPVDAEWQLVYPAD